MRLNSEHWRYVSKIKIKLHRKTFLSKIFELLCSVKAPHLTSFETMDRFSEDLKRESEIGSLSQSLSLSFLSLPFSGKYFFSVLIGIVQQTVRPQLSSQDFF
ncbi:hypothetical protein XENOCAPTIV_024689 [Xenoophorus captivus]|uniref:Maturase K n=1 Tax=Xenoophorus captivus TaxID=1517983 RepID=A0ABV0R205_9TELE